MCPGVDKEYLEVFGQNREPTMRPGSVAQQIILKAVKLSVYEEGFRCGRK